MTTVQSNQTAVNDTEEHADLLQPQVLYTLAQAKRLLGISRTATIRRYAAQGLIRILKANVRRWYVEASEVQAFPSRLRALRPQQPRVTKTEWHQKLIDFGVLEGKSDRKSTQI